MADVRLFDQQQREVRTSLTGYALLRDPMLNKGTAFTAEERETFALEGLLPTSIASMEGQLKRVRSNYDRYKNDLDRYVFLRSLQDRNETLFYAFVLRHLEEMAPIVYTPTVGDAVRKFSQIWRRARGLHLNAENIDRLETILKNYPGHESIRLIVATDSEGILGIGDQGLGGLGIPIGKLSLYVLGAGIHPSQCLPIVLDVGTNNRAHLNDPAYLGWRHERLPDDEYFGLMEKFVAALNRCLPGALLQWEDFSKQNAFTLLDTYRPQILSFNDDIQGTGAVTLGGTLAALKLIGAEMNQQRFVIHGAGAGGIGVARRLMAGLVRGGLTENEAKRRLYVLDSRGLILDDRSNLDDYKIPFAQPRAAIDSWTLHDPN
ncbi:MAG: oxaloacetate-decarboxylating malate dehydrogenase [Candidatus Poribacteria bacterium]|nr:oxaloacetate-decarboxylating malate dehydrogenase [Candidatus Poribacteria bacterium]